MWDMHCAYRVCSGDSPVILPRGFRAEARYTVRSLGRTAGELWMRAALPVVTKGLERVPVYVRGVHTFKETFASVDLNRTDLWPWVFETLDAGSGGIEGEIDRKTGYDDSASLVIRGKEGSRGRWIATTLGPAFGDTPFVAGRRYRLSAHVRSTAGVAHVALAVHRTDAPGLFDPQSYDEFAASAPPPGQGGWALCIVVTPVIDPAPDRVHLRLAHEGEGTSWFDNVLFEEFD